MSIEQRGETWVVPCREWAALHLDIDIRYEFSCRKNAQRAVSLSRRNKITQLCHYMQKLYCRVCACEITMMRAKKELASYDLDVADSVLGSLSGGEDSGTVGSGEVSIGGGSGTEGSGGVACESSAATF